MKDRWRKVWLETGRLGRRFWKIQIYLSGFTTIINNPKSQWFITTNIHFQNLGVLQPQTFIFHSCICGSTEGWFSLSWAWLIDMCSLGLSFQDPGWTSDGFSAPCAPMGGWQECRTETGKVSWSLCSELAQCPFGPHHASQSFMAKLRVCRAQWDSHPEGEEGESKYWLNLLTQPGLPWWLWLWRICLQCRRSRFDAWLGKLPWRRTWQPTPVFLPGEPHGQRSLVGYSPWGHRRVEYRWATNTHMH